MGQESIYHNSQDTLLYKHNKSLLNQVELCYIQNKFAIKNDYNEYKALHDFLLIDIYKTKNSEVVEFLNKKLNGCLGKGTIEVVDLKTLQLKNKELNKYYYVQPTWKKSEW